MKPGTIHGSDVARSQLLRKMIERKLIKPIAVGKRSYQIVMGIGALSVFILRQLDELGFLPKILKEDL
ncbi:hypothetical protein [Glutamicibacter sp.]|uniref:hypothetical protein n=1 Tax=Glutamicibacter sp. TaxID=1931995 RepID=UPI002FE07CDC